MRPPFVRLLFPALLGALTAAACGGGYESPARSGATTIQLDLSGYKFTPEVVEVEAGETARFELAGDGLAHTFTIRAIGVDIPIPEGTKSQVIELPVPRTLSGNLQLICAFHELAGMIGTVRVN